MSKPLLLLSAPVSTRSGYGEHSRDIFSAFFNLDKFDIKIINQPWGNTPMNALDDKNPMHQEIKKRLIPSNSQIPRQPDIWVQITIPSEFQKVGKFNIGITAGIETTVCAPEWIEGLNKMDLVIVPSKFTKDVLESVVYDVVDDRTKNVTGSLKCNTPIEVVFEGVDLNIYNPNITPSTNIRHEINSIKENFLFLFVGHWLKGDIGHDRKDVGMLVKIFLETFKNERNPPALVLKSSGASFSIIDREEILKKIKKIKQSVSPSASMPNIYLLHGDLTSEEMNSLYNHSKIKAHVSFTKGEGFGRPLLEASLSGKPIIASKWSGHLDFLHDSYNLLISGKLQNVHQSAVWDKVLLKESQWFYIDYQQAANALYRVFKNYKAAKDMVRPQKNYAKKFSLDNMNKLMGEVLSKHLPTFPEHVPLVIPKIKKIELPKKGDII